MKPSLLLALLLATCLPAGAAQYAGGDVAGTWRAADSPHLVLADVRVPTGSSLIVEPGSAVIVASGATLRVEGTLEASGSTGGSITFDADPAVRVPGSWGGIVLQGAGTHVLRHVSLRHAVTGVRLGPDASALVEDSAITQCLEDGLVLEDGSSAAIEDTLVGWNGGTGIVVGSATAGVLRCSLLGNDRPLRMGANSFPSLREIESSLNASGDGLAVDVTQPVTRSGAWTDAGAPYVIESGTLDVDTSAYLMMEPGAVLKLGTAAGIRVRGAFAAMGTEVSRCALVSLADDGVAGDTNGDGGSTVAQKGDWGGIDVEGGGIAYLLRTDVRDATDAVRVQPSGRVILVASEVARSLFRGLAFGPGAQGRLELTVLHDNEVGIEVQDPAGLEIGVTPQAKGGNSFGCNGWLDVDNRSAATLPALGNYWTSTPPDPSRFAGPVDAGQFLVADTETVARRQVLRVRRAGDDLELRWVESTGCSAYRVETSPLAAGVFGTAARVGTDETWTDVSAATRPDDLLFYRIGSDEPGSGRE